MSDYYDRLRQLEDDFNKRVREARDQARDRFRELKDLHDRLHDLRRDNLKAIEDCDLLRSWRIERQIEDVQHKIKLLS